MITEELIENCNKKLCEDPDPEHIRIHKQGKKLWGIIGNTNVEEH